MEKLEELKKQLKILNQEELEQIKEFLNAENGDAGEQEEIVKTDEKSSEEINNDSTDEIDDSSLQDNSTEINETEEESLQEESESNNDEQKTQTDSNEGKIDPVSTSSMKDADIPIMQKIMPSQDEGIESDQAQVTDDCSPNELEQIVEAQKAKISALETELASLKSKFDGAFGYSSKPPISGKVNSLYDECSDIHFHK